MVQSELAALAKDIEASRQHDAGLNRRAFAKVSDRFPSIDRAMTKAGAPDTVDAVLLLIDHCFPGWSISMVGTASEAHGDWTCTLRQSAIRDNDSFLGVGKGPLLSNAMLAALLRAMASQAPN